ncbi:Uma2 family endonuclease [Hymenobacter psoromatis]|uniref:Uma2 family endonuclease n=1 Tax=Hymenobacter psoromatis TaxID=1484116 RepID=UPI001CBACFD9|nr:Uma2 family endonuclease [Hymenobacter psoromatis]
MDVIKLKTPVLDRLTEAEFAQFCLDHRDLRIERNSSGQITIMPPVFTESGFANNELSYQLTHWNHRTRLGRVGDSSTGYTLPGGAMLSPDASWVAEKRWQALAPDDRRRFARICPDFVLELASSSDRLPDLLTKMHDWLGAGVRLAWLIVPSTETVYVFEPPHPPRLVQGFEQSLSGDPVLPGFLLELKELRSVE